MLSRTTIQSPVGKLTLLADESHLLAVLWANEEPRRIRIGPARDEREHPVLVEAAGQLSEYFSGKRTTFAVRTRYDGTPYEQRVWQKLLRIPYGQTRSYGDLARALGNASAARAVGLAASKNPLSIVVPCHRVIGADGRLTGFAGGLETKARLLALETALPRSDDRQPVLRDRR